MSRRSRRHAIPYHDDPDTPLLTFGGEPWTLRDSWEAVSSTGAPGSAKTTGSGAAILQALLLAGYGGVYLCAKSDAVDEIHKAAKATGRLQDLDYFDATTNSHKMNILDVGKQCLGGDAFGQTTSALMSKMAEVTRRANGTEGGDSDSLFFRMAADQCMAHGTALLDGAYGTVRMRDLDQLIASAPQSVAEARSEEWKKTFCYRTLATLAMKIKQARRSGTPDTRLENIARDHGDYFPDTMAKLDVRPRSSVIATVNNTLFQFLSGKLEELFCTETTITPMAARDGRIFVLNLPPLVFGPGGAVSQMLFAHLFGLAMQSKPVDKHTRPVFLFADEAQHFIDDGCADLLATARSSKICVVYITQDLPTYYAKLGANSRDVTESLLSKFGTRIFHANLSRETNQAAAELIGKVEKFHITETRSHGSSVGSGDNQHDKSGGFHGSQGRTIGTSEATAGYVHYAIPSDFFATRLRTGGPKHKFKADAIVVRTARTWKSTGRHWVMAEFDQRGRNR